jgi:hypothetical protein
MATGAIYDNEESSRIQKTLDDFNRPVEEVSTQKKDLNKKVTIGIYIIGGTIALVLAINYLFKK